MSQDVALCVVLGGDGTILRALRHYACTPVPVFAVNFGEVGFLATVTQEHLDEGIARALAGQFDLLHLPAIVVEARQGSLRAFNDVAVHRKAGDRVAKLAYALDGEEVGSARCDGLVVATPAGSTGYNLANGGPVMAWGVEGFVVSFIAPHSLTARALVAAPANNLMIHNRSRDALELAVDGRYAGDIAPGASLRGELRRQRRHDRPAARLLVLRALAREVRPTGPLRRRGRSGGGRLVVVPSSFDRPRLVHRGDEVVKLLA